MKRKLEHFTPWNLWERNFSLLGVNLHSIYACFIHSLQAFDAKFTPRSYKIMINPLLTHFCRNHVEKQAFYSKK